MLEVLLLCTNPPTRLGAIRELEQRGLVVTAISDQETVIRGLEKLSAVFLPATERSYWDRFLHSQCKGLPVMTFSMATYRLEIR